METTVTATVRDLHGEEASSTALLDDGTPPVDILGAIEQAERERRDASPLAAVPDAAAENWGSSTGTSEREYYENEQTTLFPPVRRADTHTMKVSPGGTIEMTRERYEALLNGARLGPGAVVEIRAVGYVVQPGAAWVRRTEGSGEDREVRFEREGRVKIRLVDIGELSATGEEFSGE